MSELKWRARRGLDGRDVPGCWETDSGYIVAECRLPETKYTITRPGGSVPFAYVVSREEVVAVIKADKLAEELADAS